ncbi:hypothetical protein [Paraflavitalea soli]|uniref:hypothetical protein n=1 Tax=Paraflavitalea soli TaxID=2315862 RepID=UPI0013C53941|nr:hypothetical protein [Paraflavitalea soli]
MKKVRADNPTDYQELSNDLYNFDFGKYVSAVRSFIDFYEPGLIEDEDISAA